MHVKCNVIMYNYCTPNTRTAENVYYNIIHYIIIIILPRFQNGFIKKIESRAYTSSILVKTYYYVPNILF